MHTSAFEIVGPTMVGPSSSHTAGAVRIALTARSLAGAPLQSVDIILYNSFARTHLGHGTVRALIAGLLGLAPDDVRVKDSLDLAIRAGLTFKIHEGRDGTKPHPNTVSLAMHTTTGRNLEVCGESLGGGRISISEINGVVVKITGDYPTLFVAHTDTPGVLSALTAILAKEHLNIATMRTFRKQPGGEAYTIFETDEPASQEVVAACEEVPHVQFASLVNIPGTMPLKPRVNLKYDFASANRLMELCRNKQMSIAGMMRLREQKLRSSKKIPDQLMKNIIDTMRAETHEALEQPEHSLGGFLYGEAKRVAETPTPFISATQRRSMAYAMATIERSASMGVIVAAPTAGAAGVVPGVLLAAQETLEVDDGALARALWCAAAIGLLIAQNASIAGAEGGCQAEVGTAAAMAAAGLIELQGGTPQQALNAASIAITNLEGLVCDPVMGLVEYPCQQRNAAGVAIAFSAAQLAQANVCGPIPFDEVVDAMRETGQSLPESLRETARGGLAATPTACQLCHKYRLHF
jgi:L-serine dehydratase